MKINILGSEYEILSQTDTENEELLTKDGYADFYSNKIYAKKFVAGKGCYSDLDAVCKKVMRHELTHAFMFESGLDVNSEWGRDETLIDWIALQMPKMVRAMKEADCL